MRKSLSAREKEFYNEFIRIEEKGYEPVEKPRKVRLKKYCTDATVSP